MASSQTCVRCRRRRMKCDLKLPKCGSCNHAGVECYTVDIGTDENVPRSYIFSLHQQVQTLERQITNHHSNVLNAVQDAPQMTPSPPHYEYIGPGTTVHLFDQLCRLPALFNTGSPKVQLTDSQMERMATADDSRPLLPISGSHVDHILTPTIQRGLLTYFWERVRSEVPPVLSEDQEQTFWEPQFSLAACHLDPNPWLRIMFLSVLAVSARLMSRDLQTEYAYIDHICWNEVHKALTNTRNKSPAYDEHTLDQVTVICLSILRDLVGPGQSRVSLDILNAAQLLLAIKPYIPPNNRNGLDAVSRLGFFLSQIEASICSHFKRPSAQYQTLRSLSTQPVTCLDLLMDVSQVFHGVEKVSGTTLESVLLEKIRISDLRRHLPMDKALLYLSLHPVFSDDVTWLRTETVDCPCSTGLLIQIAAGARSYIEHTADTCSAQLTICIWLTLERLLQAGFVWVIYILHHSRLSASSDYHLDALGLPSLLEPLALCESALTLLSNKWKPGLPYYTTWAIIRHRVFRALSTKDTSLSVRSSHRHY